MEACLTIYTMERSEFRLVQYCAIFSSWVLFVSVSLAYQLIVKDSLTLLVHIR